MSYILKALKKSEAERAKGAVPRLTPQQAPVPRTRGAAWPWIIGAALVVNATVVVFAAWGPDIALLTGGGQSDVNAPVVTSPAPQPGANGAALTAAAPEAPANGAKPVRPPIPPPSLGARQGAAATGPTNPSNRLAGVQAAQPHTPPRPPAAQPQSAPPRQAAPPQSPSPREAAQPQSPPRHPAVQPQSRSPRQAAQPQSPPSRQVAQPQSPPQGSAAQPWAAPVPAARQDAPSQTAAATSGAADQVATAPLPPVVGNSPPPAAVPESVALAVPGAGPPKPPRKPREALSLLARRPAPGDPLPLAGGSQGPAAVGPEVALAAPEPAPLEAEAPPEPEPDPYDGVPMLWQLPSVIRSKLPELSMSVHVYSPEAAGRFVIVDRKKYREGDVVTGGVKIEAIVADGIVLDYQGRRYRIAN